jgi:hypothetical protein
MKILKEMEGVEIKAVLSIHKLLLFFFFSGSGSDLTFNFGSGSGCSSWLFVKQAF